MFAFRSGFGIPVESAGPRELEPVVELWRVSYLFVRE